MAAAAAANDGDLISGKMIAALFAAIFAGGGGIWIGRKGCESAAERGWAKREESLRTEIANQLRMKITNDPLSVEQSSYQAAMKANAKDHENLFFRMSSVEKDVAGIKADNAAQNRLLDRMVNRIDALYDRIILGGKKK